MNRVIKLLNKKIEWIEQFNYAFTGRNLEYTFKIISSDNKISMFRKYKQK